jgi:hypothetical protein
MVGDTAGCVGVREGGTVGVTVGVRVGLGDIVGESVVCAVGTACVSRRAPVSVVAGVGEADACGDVVCVAVGAAGDVLSNTCVPVTAAAGGFSPGA